MHRKPNNTPPRNVPSSSGKVAPSSAKAGKTSSSSPSTSPYYQYSPLSYANKPENDSIVSLLARKHLNAVFMRIESADLNPSYFHRKATRESADAELRSRPVGTYLVRPSSQSGCYALTFVNERRHVRHNLIYSQFPGFSFKEVVDNKSEIYPSISELLKSCSYLTEPLPDPHVQTGELCKSSTGYSPQKEMPCLLTKGVNASMDSILTSYYHREETVQHLMELLRNNDPLVTSLEWELSVLEEPGSYKTPDQSEQRTHIKFGFEAYQSPTFFRVSETIAEEFFLTFALSHTLRSVRINGFSGLMNYNHVANIGDVELNELVRALYSNTSITSLDVSRNAITDAGASLFDGLLRSHMTLRSLNFDYNFIGVEGVAAICYGMIGNEQNVLDDVSVAKQLQMKLGTRTLVSNLFHATLVKLVSDVSKRKLELIPSHPGGLAYFHGYLIPSEAEKRLLDDTSHGKVFCYHDGTCLQHRVVYRTPFGYSFVRIAQSGTLEERMGLNEIAPVPSLFDSAAWFVGSVPGLSQRVRANNSDVAQRFANVANLSPLWRLSHIPTAAEFFETPPSTRFVAYPSITFLVQRNSSFLIHPVVCKKK